MNSKGELDSLDFPWIYRNIPKKYVVLRLKCRFILFIQKIWCLLLKIETACMYIATMPKYTNIADLGQLKYLFSLNLTVAEVFLTEIQCRRPALRLISTTLNVCWSNKMLDSAVHSLRMQDYKCNLHHQQKKWCVARNVFSET